jgi:adenylyltransferase/sulfurtransferase
MGLTMNVIPGKTACYLCLIGNKGKRSGEATCSTNGVLNMITRIIASYQSVEAIKILQQDPDVRTELLCIDMWNNQSVDVTVDPVLDCPVCQRG